MKIIDDKGRLFGKVNIIDFLVILFLLSCVGVFFYSYIAISRRPAVTIVKEMVELELPYSLIKLKAEDIKLIALGDKEIDNGGNTIGEISWVGEVMPYQHSINVGDRIIIKEDADFKTLPVKIKLKGEVRGDSIYYKNKQVSVNTVIDFKTDKYSLLAMYSPPLIEKWLEVKVRLSGISPELSNMIQSGYTEKDTAGRVVGKLKEILYNAPSQVQALKVEEGRFIFVTDPSRNDITVLLDILCKKKEDTFYFKDYSIKVGNMVTLVSDTYAVSGTIIGVAEK